MNTSSAKLTGALMVRSMLLLFCSFLFALVLNSYIIHEAGHAFGGFLYGCKIKGLIINPFGTGGWKSQCPNYMPTAGRFLQGMGGPIFGLPMSVAITFVLWRKRKPILLPFLMSATVVLTANFFGVLDSVQDYPGYVFDYGWMLRVGVSPSIIWLIGITSFVSGIIMMNLMIPLTGIGYKDPFWKFLLLNFATWPLYLLIRLIVQFQQGVNIAGPLSFLLFGLILVPITALPAKPIIKFLSRFTNMEPVLPSRQAIWFAVGLGAGLTVILSLLNPIWVRL